MPDGHLVKDLGVALRKLPDAPQPEGSPGPLADLLLEVDFLLEARRLKLASSTIELARWYGCNRHTIARYLTLADLALAVRTRALAGEAELFAIDGLCAVAQLPEDQQQAAFDALLAVIATEGPRKGKPPRILDARRHSLMVRCVVAFSPRVFLEHRDSVHAHLREILARVGAINQEQRSSRQPSPPERPLAEVRVLLEKHHWLSAEQLVLLYFSKDVVEKDFQTIKSELDLRPIRHRTDLKVCAHVSLCMLALLLQRVAEQLMAAEGAPRTAACRLYLHAKRKWLFLLVFHFSVVNLGGGQAPPEPTRSRSGSD
ncbi:MAG: hypothetical protein ABIO70_30495 [Pseudomonadota bacterium]